MYMMIGDITKYSIWEKIGYHDRPQGRPHELDKKFFEWVKQNDKFDMLTVILDNRNDSSIEIVSKTRQRKLNKILND